jgi:hypothetical protein
MRVRQKTQLQRHILCHIVDSIGIKDFVFRATVASHNLLPLVKLGEKQGRDWRSISTWRSICIWRGSFAVPSHSWGCVHSRFSSVQSTWKPAGPLGTPTTSKESRRGYLVGEGKEVLPSSCSPLLCICRRRGTRAWTGWAPPGCSSQGRPNVAAAPRSRSGSV